MSEARFLEVRRAARYLVEGDPRAELDEVWFVLHGYAQRADEFLPEFAGIARPDRLIVAPEGLSRFYREGSSGEVGASWMTSCEREAEIADYLAYLDALHAALRLPERPQVRLTVLGYSQGAATASRWAALGAARVHRLVLWAGGLPPDLDPSVHRERLAAQHPTYVLGTRDAFVSAERAAQERERWEAAGLEVRLVTFQGGHRMDRDVLARLAAEGQRASGR